MRVVCAVRCRVRCVLLFINSLSSRDPQREAIKHGAVIVMAKAFDSHQGRHHLQTFSDGYDTIADAGYKLYFLSSEVLHAVVTYAVYCGFDGVFSLQYFACICLATGLPYHRAPRSSMT